MLTATRLVLTTALLWFVLACGGEPADAQPEEGGTAQITPQLIPPGFGFPGQRAEIQQWADQWQIDVIRAKAWDLWGGMTSETPTSGGGTLPVWETWCGTTLAFSKECMEPRERPSREFQQASQLSHAATASPSDLRLVAFNKYNVSMAAFVAESHPGPGMQEYDYTSKQSLADLNAAWPQGTPIADRKIQDTPYVAPTPQRRGAAAIETKPVMFLVKEGQLTPVPLWRGPQDSSTADRPSSSSNCKGVTDASSPNAINCHPDPTSWYTCVLLDSTDRYAPPDTPPVPATPQQIDGAVQDSSLACKTYLYAPVSTVYHFQMNQDEADAWNQVQGGVTGEGLTAEAGDYAVLTAMHVNTKEIVNWTWQTFYWQPGRDTPNAYPGSKAGMTDKVKGPWSNYAMCTAYNQTQGAGSTEMVICFNPYLETSSGIPDGLQSNCMSCHGTATAGSLNEKGSLNTLNYPPDYTAPIDFKTDPRYQGFTQTDFSWAIPSNAK